MPLLGFRVANVINLIRHFFHLEMNELASCRLLGSWCRTIDRCHDDLQSIELLQ